MKAGVGYDNSKDNISLGIKVAENAMENGNIIKPSLVFAFCGGQVDHDKFFKGLQTVIGDKIPIIGGSAIGIITNDYLSYKGYPAGAAIIDSDKLQHIEAAVEDLDKDEKTAGEKIGKKLSEGIDGKLMVIFYDSVKHAPTATTPPIINASPLLINGIEETFKSKLPIIGAGLIGDYAFSPTKQFCGSYVADQSVVATLLGGSFEPYFRIMHGCTPQDGIYHTITKIKGPFVYELDKKPIVKIIDDKYGNQDWRKQVPVKRLSIGVNHGEKYEEYQEGNYVNRLITGTMPDGEGIVLFEPDLEEGTEILFMLRDSKKMIESARVNSVELMEEIKADGRKPVLGLYIDCAGRSASFSNTTTEEASEVQKVFKQYNTPLLGFYSGVEIAPLLGNSKGLDWTGVLLVLAKDIYS